MSFSAAAYAENISDTRQQAFKSMAASHKYQHDVCIAIGRNFRQDHTFANYVRGKCMLYESDRQRLLTAVFPVTNKNNPSYNEQYPVLMSNFAIARNNDEIKSYRQIVIEYCKYNAYKFVNKDPQTCSAQRINSLF